MTLYLLSKRMSPEEKAAEDRKRTMARVGLASNVVGITAGTGALVSALKEPAIRNKVGTEIAPKPYKITRGGKRVAIGLAALQGANLAGDAVANRVLADSSKDDTKGATKVKKHEEGTVEPYCSPAERGSGRGVRLDAVEKAYRRFDPEADRQRRYGLYTGVLGGSAIALGSQVGRNYSPDVRLVDGSKVRGIAVKPGRGRMAALTTLGTLAAGAGAAHVYRRGISERNNPWN